VHEFGVSLEVVKFERTIQKNACLKVFGMNGGGCFQVSIKIVFKGWDIVGVG
jgi:hypothetical protein